MLHRKILSIKVFHDLFYGKVTYGNFGNFSSSIGKRVTEDFSETLADCDLKIGKYGHQLSL